MEVNLAAFGYYLVLHTSANTETLTGRAHECSLNPRSVQLLAPMKPRHVSTDETN